MRGVNRSAPNQSLRCMIHLGEIERSPKQVFTRVQIQQVIWLLRLCSVNQPSQVQSKRHLPGSRNLIDRGHSRNIQRLFFACRVRTTLIDLCAITDLCQIVGRDVRVDHTSHQGILDRRFTGTLKNGAINRVIEQPVTNAKCI